MFRFRRMNLLRSGDVEPTFLTAEGAAYWAMSKTLSEPLTATAALAIDSYINNLQNEGLWYIFDRCWVFPPGCETLATFDLVSILGSQFQYTYVGSYTYDQNGWTGDGVTGYIDTNYSLINDAINVAADSAMVYAYIRTDLVPLSTTPVFGVNDGSDVLNYSSKYGSISCGMWDEAVSGSSFESFLWGGCQVHTQTGDDVYIWANDVELLNSGPQANASPLYNIYLGATNDNDISPVDYAAINISSCIISGGIGITEAYSIGAYNYYLQSSIVAGGRAVITY